MQKIKFNKRNQVYFSVVLFFYSIVSIVINNITYPTQGVNDDEFFAQLVSGEYTGSRESFTHISPASPQWAFGFIVSKFYVFDLNLSWYYLILLITVLFSLAYVTTNVYVQSNYAIEMKSLFIIILSILFLLWYVPSPTYTSTAFICALAGISKYFSIIDYDLKYKHYIIPSIFLGWSSSIRTESFLASLVFFTPILFAILLMSRKFIKKRIKQLILISIIPITVSIINIFIDYQYFSKDEWKEYKVFNEVRYEIQDNEIERIISENPSLYGWNEYEYRLFNNYNFISYDSFSGVKLISVRDKTQFNSSNQFVFNINDVLKRWDTYFKPFYSVFISSLFLFLFFIFDFLLSRRYKLLIQFTIITTFSLVANLILLIGITIFLRLPERIVFPFSFFFPVWIILIALHINKNSRIILRNRLFFIVNVLLTVLFVYILWPTAKHLYTLKINPAYTSFWSEQRIFFEDNAKERILIGNASQFKSIWSNPYRKQSEGNKILNYSLGWYTFSPYWYERGELLGLNTNSIIEELASNPKVVWVSDEQNVLDVIALISRQKSVILEYQVLGTKTFDFGDYNIYSLNKKR
jgi:hypothetical protein